MLQVLHSNMVLPSACGRCSAPASPSAKRRVEDKATMRFETPPRKPLPIDFGSRHITIDGESVKVFLFVVTLGSSRRLCIRAFCHQHQSAWFAATSTGCRSRCCWITPGRWLITTTRRTAKWCSTSGCRPLRATGCSGRWHERRTAPVPKARTSVALTM